MTYQSALSMYGLHELQDNTLVPVTYFCACKYVPKNFGVVDQGSKRKSKNKI